MKFWSFVGWKQKYKKPLTKILLKRIPVSERVIETTDVEFFYKHNKDLRRELLVCKPYDLQELIFDENDDLLVYLRNYHQKPY